MRRPIHMYISIYTALCVCYICSIEISPISQEHIPIIVSRHPIIHVTETRFLNIKIETTTATVPFAFPKTARPRKETGIILITKV